MLALSLATGMRLSALSLCLVAACSLHAGRGRERPAEPPKTDLRWLRQMEGRPLSVLIARLGPKAGDALFITGCRGNDVVALLITIEGQEVVVWFWTPEPLWYADAEERWPRWCRDAVIVRMAFFPPLPESDG